MKRRRKKNSYQEWMKLARAFHVFNNPLSLKIIFLLPQPRKHWARHENSIDILFPHPSLSYTAGFFPSLLFLYPIQRIKEKRRQEEGKKQLIRKIHPRDFLVSRFSSFPRFSFFLSGSFLWGWTKKCFSFSFKWWQKILASFIKYSTSIMSWENTETLRIEGKTFFDSQIR